MRFQKVLFVLGFLGLAVFSTDLATAQVGTPPITYNGGGSSNGGGSCTGSFCSASAPLAVNLGGTGADNSATSGYFKFTTGSASFLTATQVTADLNLFSSTLKGLVPLSGGGTTNFLRADGTWAAPGGGGTPCTTTALSIQFNSSGSFGCVSGVISNGTSMQISSSDLLLEGSSSGGVTLNAPATGGGVLTLPPGTDTIAGLAATQTVINKTISGSSNTLSNIATGSLATVQGNGTKVQLSTGSTTTGHNAVYDANGNVVDSGAAPATGTVTSVATGACLTGGPITTTGTVAGTYVIDARTTTTEAITAASACKLVTFNNGSATAASLVQATGSAGAGFSFDVENIGAGVVTITPTTSTINGSATLTLAQNTGCTITSDGMNYQISACTAKLPTGSGTVTSVALASASNVACVVSGSPVTTTGTLTCTPAGTSGGVPYFSSSSALSSSAALAANALVIGGGAGASPATTTTGTGVLTALGNNLSAAGGVTSTIASGTSAMGTGAITSGTCATVVTTTATNTATTDVIMAGFNGDPTAVTGYAPATAGMLTIISYPTANNVNFKVCNNTSSSITPGAITLNWRVVR